MNLTRVCLAGIFFWMEIKSDTIGIWLFYFLVQNSTVMTLNPGKKIILKKLKQFFILKLIRKFIFSFFFFLKIKWSWKMSLERDTTVANCIPLKSYYLRHGGLNENQAQNPSKIGDCRSIKLSNGRRGAVRSSINQRGSYRLSTGKSKNRELLAEHPTVNWWMNLAEFHVKRKFRWHVCE